MPFRPSVILSCLLLSHAFALTAAEPSPKPVLRIVYFTPSDRQPIPGYAERLDKVLEHVRQFYRDGMAAAGFGQRTFNLDRNRDGSLRLFIVCGEHPTEKYGRDSGWLVQQECQKALAKEGIEVDIAGIDMLELIVENAGNGNAADWGVWLEPVLKR